jgi:polysaccharide biosynthesis protein PslF
MTCVPPSDARRVALVSTFPPTQCGLATFAAATRRTLSLVRPQWELPVIEVVPHVRKTAETRSQIAVQWQHGNQDSTYRAIKFANSCDAVVLQHEYGIFGGPDGDELLEFLKGVTVPMVAELHTVVKEPSIGQRRILTALGRTCTALVVMSEAARRRLLTVTSVPAGKVVVIPHGAHATPYHLPLSLDRVPEILTWGLVGPGKGLEYAIDAVAKVISRGLDVTYRIVGETHPKVREAQGERYRISLIDRAQQLGIAAHVKFDDTYRSVEELQSIIGNADLVLVPYDSTEQVTSGVLVEALASGRPVIATDFPHAVELLGGGVGVAVKHHDANAMSEAILNVLTNKKRAQQMSRDALRIGKATLWPAVGETLASLVEEVFERHAPRVINASRSSCWLMTAAPTQRSAAP